MDDTPTPRTKRTGLWIVLAIIVALLLACIAAALAGAIGFAVGRSQARAVGPVVEQRIERIPQQDLPLPEMPMMTSGWALVIDVTEDAPADRAGLREGDIIVSVDDESLSDEVTLADLIAEYEPGDEVELGVLRNGRERRIDVTLGSHPDDEDAPWLGLTYRQMPGAPTMYFEAPPVRGRLIPFSG